MQIFAGFENQIIYVIPSACVLGLATLLCFVVRLFYGVPSYNPELFYLPLRQNTSRYHSQCATYFPLNNFYRNYKNIFKLPTSITTATSTVFEYNAGAIELARCPKMRPRMKHIAVKYHHFCDHVKQGNIVIQPISTNDQNADLFTKPHPEGKLLRLRQFMIEW